MQQWWLFFSIALVTTFSPGPAVLFAVSNALGMGARTAVFGSLGNVLGLSLLSLLAFVGLGVVFATSPLAFLTLKIAGAGYLVYLALQQWQQSPQQAPSFDRPVTAQTHFSSIESRAVGSVSADVTAKQLRVADQDSTLGELPTQERWVF